MRTNNYWKLLKERYNKTIYTNPKDFLEYNQVKHSKKVLSYKW